MIKTTQRISATLFGFGLLAACGGQSQFASKQPLAVKKPNAAAPSDSPALPSAGQAVVRDKVEADPDIPGAESPVATPVATPTVDSGGPAACLTPALSNYQTLALKKGESLALPDRDSAAKKPINYVVQGALPEGATLSGQTLSAGDASRAQAVQFKIHAAFDGHADCPFAINVSLLANGVLVSEQKLTLGSKGTLFPVAKDGSYPAVTLPNGSKMPNFDQIKPMNRNALYVPVLDLTCPESAELHCVGVNGFVIDGYRDLKEYFGIRFTNTLIVEVAGIYQFQTTSDDGSSVRLVSGPGLSAPLHLVSNGGDHSVTTLSGDSLELAKGEYKMVTDFYQGPIGFFALRVKWKTPGSSEFVTIPSKALKVDE